MLLKIKMRKFLKITLITIGSILLLAVAGVAILLHVIFTPAKLTPIVNQAADSLLIAPHSLDKVELTYYKTFPYFGLEITGLCITNPMSGAQSDTVLCVPSLLLTLDTEELIYNKSLGITDISIPDATANVFIDSIGNTNLNIIKPLPTDTTQTDSGALPFSISGDHILLGLHNSSFVDIKDNLAFTGVDIDLNGKADIDSLLSPIDVDIQSLNLNWKDAELFTAGKVNISDTIKINLDTLGLRLGALPITLKGHTNINTVVSTDSLTPDNTQIELSADVKLAHWRYADIKKALKSDIWNCMPSLRSTMDTIYSKIPKELQVNAYLDIAASASGLLDNHSYPTADVSIRLSDINGHYDYTIVPFNIEKGNFDASVHFNMNQLNNSSLSINSLTADIVSLYNANPQDSNTVSLEATVTDIFPKNNFDSINPYIDLKLFSKVDLLEANPYIKSIMDTASVSMPQMAYNILHAYIPKGISTTAVEKTLKDPNTFKTFSNPINGKATINLLCKSTLDRILAADIESINGSLNVDVENLKVNMLNNYTAAIDNINFSTTAPLTDSYKSAFSEFIAEGLRNPRYRTYACLLKFSNLNVDFPYLKLNVPHGTGEIAEKYDFKKTNNEVPDSKVGFTIDDISLAIDTDRILLQKPYVEINLKPQKSNPQLQTWWLDVHTDSLICKFGKGGDYTSMGKVTFHSETNETKNSANYMLQWDPDVKFEASDFKTHYVGNSVLIPHIKATYHHQNAILDDFRVIIGNSDFRLSGKLNNLGGWMADQGKLQADLTFKSNKTDVDQLLEYAAFTTQYYNEVGYLNDTVPVKTTAPSTETSPIQLVLPTDIDFALKAKIDNATIFKQKATNLRASLYLQNGTLLLDDLGFDSDMANVSLDAKLIAPQPKPEEHKATPDSTYLGFAFQMKDIRIAKIIDMIPQVDSLMPMLRTFSGNVDMNLTWSSWYDNKYYYIQNSTNGALSISGQNLTLVPNNIYNIVSKILVFKKSDNNNIDSLYAEARLVQDTIKIYPFHIRLNKLLATVGGYNNYDAAGNITDMFYHVSVSKPILLGLDIKGKSDNLKFRLSKVRFGNSYNPVRKFEVNEQSETIENDINSAISLFLSTLRPTGQ